MEMAYAHGTKKDKDPPSLLADPTPHSLIQGFRNRFKIGPKNQLSWLAAIVSSRGRESDGGRERKTGMGVYPAETGTPHRTMPGIERILFLTRRPLTRADSRDFTHISSTQLIPSFHSRKSVAYTEGGGGGGEAARGRQTGEERVKQKEKRNNDEKSQADQTVQLLPTLGLHRER